MVQALDKYYFFQNYPNLFNSSTTICFYLPKPILINLAIYNSLGKKVSTLINEEMSVGIHCIDWNPSELPIGNYYYKLEIPEFTETKKLIINKQAPNI